MVSIPSPPPTTPTVQYVYKCVHIISLLFTMCTQHSHAIHFVYACLITECRKAKLKCVIIICIKEQIMLLMFSCTWFKFPKVVLYFPTMLVLTSPSLNHLDGIMK